MIKINLLPTEKRKAERTPLPRFFLIVSTAAAATILLVYNAWVYLKIIQMKETIRERTQYLTSLGPDVAKHDELVARRDLLASKVRDIEGLVTRDVDYWRAVNALWEVIHAHPKVWIDDIKVLDSRAAQAEVKRIDPEAKEIPPYAVTLRSHVLGEEVNEMTKFRKGLKDNMVLQETLSSINFDVHWTVQTGKETGTETINIDFNVSLFGPTTPPQRRPPSPAGKAPSAATPAGESK